MQNKGDKESYPLFSKRPACLTSEKNNRMIPKTFIKLKIWDSNSKYDVL
jgi:hypothetical protein